MTVMEGTTTLERPEVDTTDPERHERFTHIVLEGVRTPDGEFHSAGNGTIAGSLVEGTPVRALCGKVWVSKHDPKKYPLCPECKQLAEARGWKLPTS